MSNNIVLCSSEVFPFAKTGGLADVVGALALALGRKKCKVKVFMPWYKNIKPQELYEDFGVTALGNNVEVIFIRNDDYFKRDYLYGTPQGDYPDNMERFVFFGKKLIEILKRIDFKPDVIHCHDWQSTPVIILLRTIYKEDEFFKKTKMFLTIHNLAYQGIFDQDKYPILGLGWEYFNMHCLEFYGKVNLLKGGIIFADAVNTVSPTYAKQIQTPEYGCGLEGVLKEKSQRLYGILNAIDYEVWDPSMDKFIYKKYSAKNIEVKYENKKMFQKELGFKTDKDKFMLGMVSRLAEQKGVDILSEVIDDIATNYQLVILGFGEEKYHNILKEKAKKFKNSFSLNLKFDEGLAHKIYACCDAFLLPSRFEPCGLSQMISYKYGTIPIVHHTGGLVDTVQDYNEGGGGFVFYSYSSKELIATINRAYGVFKDKKKWLNLIKKVMTYNFSWDRAAQEYIDLFKKVKPLL